MSNPTQSSFHRKTRRLTTKTCNTDFTPIGWEKYFENQQQVFVKNNEFHVYSSGKTGPVLLMIHGGGYSALTWALLTKEVTNKIDCQVFAVDLRGHGSTKTDSEDDFALDVLVTDIAELVKVLFGGNNIVLVGHSLGGSIAVRAASFISNIVGVCVIDVVEEAAMEALSSMHNILRNRPKRFKTVEHAIQWSLSSRQTHNLEAARVSMPGQIKNLKTGQLAAEESRNTNCTHKRLEDLHLQSNDIILEINEGEVSNVTANLNLDKVQQGIQLKHPSSSPKDLADVVLKPPSSDYLYGWRIDLSKTEPYWNGWFKGLSQKFLDIPVPKLLLLANIHGLDTTLMIGQMQGKFQLQVLPRSGHAIHEDQPNRVAEIIAKFLIKQKIASPRQCVGCCSLTS